MKIYVQILYLFFISVNSESEVVTKAIDFVLEEVEVHQVAMIVDDDVARKYEILITDFISRYPTVFLSHEQIATRMMLSDEPFKFDRSMILFVSFYDVDDEEETLVGHLRASSRDTVGSKFLIFAMGEGTRKHFESLLKLSWDKDLIDVVVFEVIHKDDTWNHHFKPDSNEILSLVIHRFNLFTKEYASNTFTYSEVIFPNKLQDMHGYPLHVALFEYRPYSYFTNEIGENRFQGIDGELVRTLRRYINFKLVAMAGKISDLEEGILDEITTGAIDLLAFSSPNFYSYSDSKVSIIC